MVPIFAVCRNFNTSFSRQPIHGNCTPFQHIMCRLSTFQYSMGSIAIQDSKHERTITRNNGKDGRDGTGKERGAHG